MGLNPYRYLAKCKILDKAFTKSSRAYFILGKVKLSLYRAGQTFGAPGVRGSQNF
jgi:hypothetical protein